MKAFSYLWQYLSKFFLEWQMFEIKVVEKIKTHILCLVTFSQKLHRLWDNVEKCGGAWEATNDVISWRICTACWISKATCTHVQKCAMLIAFPQQKWFANLPKFYVTCKLPVSLKRTTGHDYCNNILMLNPESPHSYFTSHSKVDVMRTQRTSVFCIVLRISNYFTIQHWLTGLYNRDDMRTLCSRNWIWKYTSG
jgi:hypothetical protein